MLFHRYSFALVRGGFHREVWGSLGKYEPIPYGMHGDWAQALNRLEVFIRGVGIPLPMHDFLNLESGLEFLLFMKRFLL